MVIKTHMMIPEAMASGKFRFWRFLQMLRSLAATLIALVGMGSFAAPLHAELILGNLSGDSTLTPTGTPGVFSQNFTGEGDDTTFGSFDVNSTSTIDFSDPPHIVVTDTMFTEIFSDGSLFGTGSGGGTANGMGAATVTLDLVITGGTGIFKLAKGDAVATETLTLTSPTTVSANGTYTGTLSTVPEPGSLALLAPLALVVFFRRRLAAV